MMNGGEARTGPLAGMRVVVTRPAAQAGPFCSMLEEQGALVTRFPVIEIRSPADPAQLKAVLTALDEFDIAVFVSANAVQRVLPALRERGGWPQRVATAAIGTRTASELREHGVEPSIVPPNRFDSEALLEEPAMQQVQGRRIVVFRGDGGRPYLGETLVGRGAEVVYAEAYQRAIPEVDAAPLRQALASGRVDAITVTSGESLQNLCRMIGKGGQVALLRTALVAGATRVAAIARDEGFAGRIETAEDPTDAAMLAAVLRLRSSRTDGGAPAPADASEE
ncbi:uroporphyrinogen-III synthase [Thioalkalivibrio paradoxus]|uniref:Uroporphyrinogen-III synthase n=1 Tax=Thioalkalivibrio paradoxus ARh 1 TaxID=713585 RepID=W0DI44_9GAMM|nr:uroporphyrinogen-III synthase [Thioalkalivibrio paradoxus]AHE96932.1 uroporphyrinogen III synthase [Thioalkalivibrio paradoxus ARh 1]